VREALEAIHFVLEDRTITERRRAESEARQEVEEEVEEDAYFLPSS